MTFDTSNVRSTLKLHVQSAQNRRDDWFKGVYTGQPQAKFCYITGTFGNEVIFVCLVLLYANSFFSKTGFHVLYVKNS